MKILILACDISMADRVTDILLKEKNRLLAGY